MVEILRAIFLGIVEGITEFLPISSTGHLIIAERLVKFKDAAHIFTVVIQLGAILAVLWYYRRDIWQKIINFINGDVYDRHFGYSLIIATLPAAILGFIFSKTFDKIENLIVISLALIFGGIVLLWADRHVRVYKQKAKHEMEDMRYRHAFLIGLAQSVALIPGISRSGASIAGGLFVGLDRKTATNFSFYMSIPIMLMASSYKLIKDWQLVGSVSGGWTSIVIGFLVSFIVASMVIRWLLWYVARNSFFIFAMYRIILGIILFSLVYNNVIQK